MNPPEAVMCWACYTPLTGGAATAPASAPNSGPMVSSGGELGLKKPIPPAQLAVLGVALLLALGFGAKTFMGGSTEEGPLQPTVPTGGSDNFPTPPQGNVPPPPVVPAVPPPGGGDVPQPPQQPPPFSVVAPPNFGYSVGTLGILLTNPNTTSRQAASYAAYARQQMMRNKQWAVLHIYVFTDRESGVAFQQYQARRKSAPLEARDFAALANLWPRVLVRYEYNRGAEGILLPSRSPGNWWTGRTLYTKVKQ
ncbi:MAG TPA: hypothetical protein VF681_04190 [Abditibacteriaceae bacterium]